jgi:DNA-binding NtrC family response regulator
MERVDFGAISRLGASAGGQTASNPTKLGEISAPLSVLVVDDEPLIRWSLNKGLTRRGHEVVEARTGAEALQSIGSTADRFGVVILDFKLPDRQDLTLLADVRELLPRAVVVMMTAYGDEDMRSGALALGALAVIDKPFQVSQLIALIESAPAS